MDRLKQAHGSWVTGENFFNRENELKLFSGRIREGANILLTAQRRMGKTSLMREVMRRLENEFICLFVDFQKTKNAPDAITELSLATNPFKSLWEKTIDLFSNMLKPFKDHIEQIDLSEIGIKIRADITEGD